MVPTLPPKKVVGNKNARFVEERKSQLQQYLRDISVHHYLRISEEFRAFILSDHVVNQQTMIE